MKRYSPMFACALLLLSAVASATLAAEAPAPAAGGAAPAAKRFSLAVNNQQPRATFLQIGQASGATVLPDSTIGPGAVTADWKNVTVEEALADACKQAGAEWRLVYLPPRTTPVADNVSQLYRSLRGLYAGGIVAFEPDTDRGAMLLTNTALPKGYREAMEQPGTDFRRAYLVLRPNIPLRQQQADNGRPWQPGEPLSVQNFSRLQRDLAVAMAQMTPEEREAALAAGIDAQMAVFGQNPQLMQQVLLEHSLVQTRFVIQNPQVMAPVFQGMVQGQVDTLGQMAPEQRQELRQTGVDAFRQVPPDQLMTLMLLMGRTPRPRP